MLDLIYNLPEEIEDAWKLSQELKISKVIDNITICGMGGSGIGGEILKAVLYNSSGIPVIIHRDYSLPGAINNRTLLFIISYSGNTEEIINSYKEAKRQSLSPICISSGGRLAQQSEKEGDVLLKIPAGYPPRAALAYLSIPLFWVAEESGIISGIEKEIKETVDILKKRRNAYKSEAETLSAELSGFLPIVYSLSKIMDPVSIRWRCQFNENSKILCHTNSFPELNHNEIVGMGGIEPLIPLSYLIILKDPKAHPKNLRRLEWTLKILKGTFSRYFQFSPDGDSDLARIFSGILFGDFLSFYLAKRRGIDPLPVERIETLKRWLRS